jgi:mannose-6-phosphate isomerase-like protein (cupin superfamily)
MSNPVSVSKFEVQSHDEADEVRTPDKTRVEVVRLDGFTMGRMILQPGWKWSGCVKHVVKTDSCESSHVGYAVSGRLVVVGKDGKENRIAAGESYTIPPGHDAWVEGTEPFVCIEVLSADSYAKPR